MVDTVENARVRSHRIATDPPKKEFPLSKSGAKPPAKPGLIARLLGAPTPKPPPPRRYDGPAKDASRDVRAQLAAQIKAVRAKLNPQLLRIVEQNAPKGPPVHAPD